MVKTKHIISALVTMGLAFSVTGCQQHEGRASERREIRALKHDIQEKKQDIRADRREIRHEEAELGVHHKGKKKHHKKHKKAMAKPAAEAGSESTKENR